MPGRGEWSGAAELKVQCWYFCLSTQGVCVRAVAALSWGTGRAGVETAELRIAVTIWLALQVGWAVRSRAATPAARGAEALVPMA